MTDYPGLPSGYDPYLCHWKDDPEPVHDTNPVMVTAPSHYGESWGNRSNTRVNGYWVWCPGCRNAHRFETRLPETRPDFDGPLWDWDGNQEQPTFSPSLLVYGSVFLGSGTPGGNCHSFVRNGHWEFLGDCAHQLANMNVPMVPVPDWLVHG